VIAILSFFYYYYFLKAKEITCRYNLRTFVLVGSANYSIFLFVSFVSLSLSSCLSFCLSVIGAKNIVRYTEDLATKRLVKLRFHCSIFSSFLYFSLPFNVYYIFIIVIISWCDNGC